MHPDVEVLRATIRVPTVAERDPALTDPGPFERLHGLLAEHFPLLHEHLERVDLGQAAPWALLRRWPGTSSDRPVVLMAHQDVVPVTPDDPWTHPAFDADVVDTPDGPAVWGRGTLDDKGQLVAICTAVERLLGGGFTPAQDVWLSFGADEEVSGPSAPAAVDELRRRGVQPWFVLDEGGAVAGQAFPGVGAGVCPVTGIFLSRDPVAGGNDNTYIYPPDPVNKVDLDPRWGWRKKFKRVWRSNKTWRRVAKWGAVGAFGVCVVASAGACAAAGIGVAAASARSKTGKWKGKKFRKHFRRGAAWSLAGASAGGHISRAYSRFGRPRHWTRYKANIGLGVPSLPWNSRRKKRRR